MCTLSFAPQHDGYLLAMNRDEQSSRPIALPPALHRCGGTRALYPSEQGGGTWIGINEGGITAALINWYSRPQLTISPRFSRGMIIPEVLSKTSIREIEEHLFSQPLNRLQPFRLFLFFSETQTIAEYRSDSTGCECVNHEWKISHWFSSGEDEARASATRAATCRLAVMENDSGTMAWLERLHGSHFPRAGADSICVHRDDATTVSLTMLAVTPKMASMTYLGGTPCQGESGGRKEHSIKLFPEENH